MGTASPLFLPVALGGLPRSQVAQPSIQFWGVSLGKWTLRSFNLLVCR